MPDEMREKIDHREITNENIKIINMKFLCYLPPATQVEIQILKKLSKIFSIRKIFEEQKWGIQKKKHEHVQLAGSRPITVAREEIKCSIFRLTEIIVFWYYVSFYYSYSMTTFGIFLCVCCKGLMTQSINSSPLCNQCYHVIMQSPGFFSVEHIFI